MKKSSAITGAAFLMATSAIGPGFLTQTALFTSELLTSFGFVILVSILIDIGAQLNIWRIISAAEKRAQDIASQLQPGLGVFLAGMITFGGLVFNIGNMAGCGLGLSLLTGLDPRYGALLSAVLALGIFWYRDAGRLMDGFTRILGLIMIVLTLYIAFSSHPPLGEALYRTVWPEKTSMLKIVTLVGGTVGGYISFAGAHRLLDAGIRGKEQLVAVNRAAVSGILVTSVMRFILFFAALGIVMQGIPLAAENPAASVFQSAAGRTGLLFFGLVLWSAAITSVVGASYTTISFWKSMLPFVNRYEKYMISGFIMVSAILFAFMGNPVKLLILAGAVNGIILPFALALMLLAVHRKAIMNGYRHPLLLQVIGWLVVLVMSAMSVVTIRQVILKW